MIQSLFSFLSLVEESLWGFICVPLVLILGIYLTVHSKGVQVRSFPAVVKIFLNLFSVGECKTEGIHPLKTFFACVGGCVGVGNVVGVCTAIQIGGPGALFWIWVTAFVGVMLKYAEVYLGMLHRVPNSKGGYNGGPMYFLEKAFNKTWIASAACVLLCIYGIEVFQFSVITHSISENFDLNLYMVAFVLLGLVMFAALGGVSRVGSISSTVVPVFIFFYISMGLWVIGNHIYELPAAFSLVITSAFTGHAAIGGFAGGSMMIAISQGMRRACYSGDIGIGYASVIHSESATRAPEKQAALVIFDIFVEAFIVCTTSVWLILLTGVWDDPVNSGMMVQTALGHYFPYMEYFMPFFLFLLGYATINAYFVTGIKCAEHLSPRWGRKIYFTYAFVALLLFSFVDTTQAQTVMTIAGGLLLVINAWGIFQLRHQLQYNIEDEETPELVPETITN